MEFITEESQKRVFNTEKLGEEVPFTPVIEQNNDSIFVDSSKDSEKSESNTKQRIDFLKDNAATSLFASQSKRKIEDTTDERTEAEEHLNGKPPDSKIHKNSGSPIPPSDLPKAEELYDVANVMIELFDAGVSNVCSAIALGMKPSEFELTTLKKQQLSRNLSIILAKHQMKMSLEALFIIAVCLAYTPMLKKALNVRKAKKTVQKDNEGKIAEQIDNSAQAETARQQSRRTR